MVTPEFQCAFDGIGEDVRFKKASQALAGLFDLI